MCGCVQAVLLKMLTSLCVRGENHMPWTGQKTKWEVQHLYAVLVFVVIGVAVAVAVVIVVLEVGAPVVLHADYVAAESLEEVSHKPWKEQRRVRGEWVGLLTLQSDWLQKKSY